MLGRCSEETRRPSENTLVLNFHEGLQSGAITSPASQPQLNRSGNIFPHRRERKAKSRAELTTDEGEEGKKDDETLMKEAEKDKFIPE